MPSSLRSAESCILFRALIIHSYVFASKVTHSPREITEAIHGCEVQHVLASVALLQMA